MVYNVCNAILICLMMMLSTYMVVKLVEIIKYAIRVRGLDYENVDPCEIAWQETRLTGLIGLFTINSLVYLVAVVAVVLFYF